MDAELNTNPEAEGAATVDQMTADFARAWQEGSRPSIERFLDTFNGDDTETLLLRLISIDVMYQLAPGVHVDADA